MINCEAYTSYITMQKFSTSALADVMQLSEYKYPRIWISKILFQKYSIKTRKTNDNFEH